MAPDSFWGADRNTIGPLWIKPDYSAMEMRRNKLHPLLDWAPLEYVINFQRARYSKVIVAFRWRLIHISKYKLKILPQRMFLQGRNPRTLFLRILVSVEACNIKKIKSYCPQYLNWMFIRIFITWFSCKSPGFIEAKCRAKFVAFHGALTH